MKPEDLEAMLPKITNGNSTFIFPDGSEYSGDWTEVDGVKSRDGLGVYKIGPEEYNGSWSNDQMSGKGRYKFSSGAVYEGEFRKNVFEGHGEYHFPDGAIYRYFKLLNKIVRLSCLFEGASGATGRCMDKENTSIVIITVGLENSLTECMTQGDLIYL